MKIIIKFQPGSTYRVWQEGVTATRGPMTEEMAAREYYSKEEVLKAVAELLPDATGANIEEERRVQGVIKRLGYLD